METKPFNWVNQEAQRPLFVCLTILLVCVSAWLFWMDRLLVTAAAPNGIVSFELAKSIERSAAILRSWSPQAQSAAMLIQGVDYLYLFIYPAWYSLAAAGAGALHGGAWQRMGVLTSWLILLAIPLDAIENYALIQQLLHGPTEAHALLAWGCAIPKFALVAIASVFVLVAVAAWLVKSRILGSK